MVSRYGYVITGGPGSGKTSLIDALAAQGYTVFEEVSRRLIREQQLLPGGVLPWKNLSSFATLALRAMQQQHMQASSHIHPVFFDRAIPDIAGYLHCSSLPIQDTLSQALTDFRYATPVFICAPWPEIYVNDPERPQSYVEATNLYTSIKSSYQQAGYPILEVPKDTLANRVQFVLHTISSNPRG